MAVLCCVLIVLSSYTVRADNLTAQATWKDDDGTSVSAVYDGRISAWEAKSADTWLTISSPLPLNGVYIKWMAPQPGWILEYHDGTAWQALDVAPLDTLLHAYIELPGCTQVRLQGNTQPLHIVEIELYDVPLPEVQQWQPPAEKADILILVAHPDDDLLYFGGTIPYYGHELGLAVQTVFATNPSRRRASEALAGQWTAGGRYEPVFGAFPDRLTKTEDECARLWGRDKVLAFWVEQLRRFKPSVALTHDLDGEYGHGAHMLLAELIFDALVQAGDPSCFPESAELYGTWQTPKAYLHLYNQHKIEMDWNVELASMEGRKAIEVAREAYKCHESQAVNNMDVRDRGTYSSTQFGLAWTLVRDDVIGGDFLENISDDLVYALNPQAAPTPTLEPTPEPTPEVIETPVPTMEPITTPTPAALVVSEENEEEGNEATKGEMGSLIVPICVAGIGMLIAVGIFFTIQRHQRNRRRRR